MGMNTHSIIDLYLSFDGATIGGNPGDGGCGTACWDGKSPHTPIFTESTHLGFVTNNVAEYYGVIVGLRRIVQDYPMQYFDLTISGDSELVIRQLKGEYEVRSNNLIPLHHVAMGLVDRIKGKVQFEHVPREKNQIADTLAKEAATTAAPPRGDFIMFYPNVCSLLKGRINDRQLVVGNDCGTSALTPEILFDATTILELFGKSALEKLLSPGRTTQVRGKSNFTILGILSFPVTFTVTFTNGPIELKMHHVVVVDFLPYDVQISVNHPMIENSGWSVSSNDGLRFHVSSVPKRFQSHPYWQSDVIFINM